MKKLLPLFLSLAILTSCITQNRRARICAECPVNSTTKDSIVIVKKDTTIYITHREVEYRDTIICDPSGKVNDLRKVVAVGGVKATISIKNNKIKVICETDSLYQVIRGLLTERSLWSRTNSVKVVRVCEKKHKTSFDGFTFYWFIITAVFLVLKFGWKYLKSYIPFKK